MVWGLLSPTVSREWIVRLHLHLERSPVPRITMRNWTRKPELSCLWQSSRDTSLAESLLLRQITSPCWDCLEKVSPFQKQLLHGCNIGHWPCKGMGTNWYLYPERTVLTRMPSTYYTTCCDTSSTRDSSLDGTLGRFTSYTEDDPDLDRTWPLVVPYLHVLRRTPFDSRWYLSHKILCQVLRMMAQASSRDRANS